MARQATMNNRERVEALLNHKKPDRVPSWPTALGFTTVYTGTTISDFYNKPRVSYEAQKKTCQDFDFVFMPWTATATLLAWEFGGEIKWPSGEFTQAPSITRYPVEKPEDVYKLEMPDIMTSGFLPIFYEFCQISAQERLDNEPFNVVANPGTGVFTGTANIPGPSNFVKWMIKAPDAVRHLLRLGTDYYVELGRIWKEKFGTQYNLPLFGEPSCSNQLISPKQFEEFALPCMSEVADKLIAMGYKHLWIHICGDQNLNLPHWAKMNCGDPGIISTPHEIDLGKMAEYFPDDVIFGNIEPRIIQVEKPDVVYEETKRVVEQGKALSNGFIFSQGCELPPMSPVENVKAMQQAVEDYGWY